MICENCYYCDCILEDHPNTGLPQSVTYECGNSSVTGGGFLFITQAPISCPYFEEGAPMMYTIQEEGYVPFP